MQILRPLTPTESVSTLPRSPGDFHTLMHTRTHTHARAHTQFKKAQIQVTYENNWNYERRRSTRWVRNRENEIRDKTNDKVWRRK